jgi:hypothetical protein
MEALSTPKEIVLSRIMSFKMINQYTAPNLIAAILSFGIVTRHLFA